MASTKQQENMLLTEHFTWPPISLIDDIINAVNEVLYRCTDSFETGLSAADPSLLGFADLYASQGRTPDKDEDGQDVYPEAKLEIEEGVLKLETLMENAVDKNFDKLEIWTLRNVFALGRGKGGDEGLGDWVRLGHYENVEPPSKDTTLTPEALYTLRRKLIETQKLNAALVAEKTRNDAQIARLRALIQPNTTTTTTKRETRNSTSPTEQQQQQNKNTNAPFAFLTHTPAAQSLGLHSLPTTPTLDDKNTEKTAPLTTHTTFTTSQLPYLRQLLASLKPHLPTTALPSNTTTSTTPHSASPAQAGAKNKEELSRERKVYVESQSKRILERRGVDTKDGVEGVWEGSSRVRADEVRGLEGLVASLEKGDTRAGAKEEEERDVDAMDTS
ncbi:Mis12 domain containing protein [Pyrenophora teres f. maculata]|nr:Mis12 domain containing protein [Pyrenophora teres f. maculata]